MHQETIIYETQKTLRKSMYSNPSKHDHLLNTNDIKKKCTSIYKYISKYEPLLNKEVFKENVSSCTIMYQNTIIYETQNNL